MNIKLDSIMKKLNITGKELLDAEDESDVELQRTKEEILKKLE